MKQLFWKEFYELRLLPAGGALAIGLLLAGVKAYTRYNGDPFPTPDVLLPVLVGVALLFGVLAGASLFAQEIGAGTLQFLSSLPTSRRTIWWVKVVTAIALLLLSLLTSAVAWIVLCELWSPDGFATMARRLPLSELVSGTGICLLGVAFCFAVSLAISPFFDRSLSASVAGLLACIALGVMSTSGPFPVRASHNSSLFVVTVFVLYVLVFGAISYWTFTRGESLRGSRRFVVGGKTAGIGLAAGLAILGMGALFGVW